jgi:hypothetical protein
LRVVSRTCYVQGKRSDWKEGLVKRNRTTAVIVAILLALAMGIVSGQTKAAKTDDQIKQDIITASIAAYKGSCPCPYSKDRAGHNCGARSAYSRPGGASPLCYAKDVTQKMVDDYRKKSGE